MVCRWLWFPLMNLIEELLRRTETSEKKKKLPFKLEFWIMNQAQDLLQWHAHARTHLHSHSHTRVRYTSKWHAECGIWCDRSANARAYQSVPQIQIIGLDTQQKKKINLYTQNTAFENLSRIYLFFFFSLERIVPSFSTHWNLVNFKRKCLAMWKEETDSLTVMSKKNKVEHTFVIVDCV